MEAYWSGIMLQSGLILALGAQNIFVLESGIRQRFPYWVATVTTLCDFILIVVGIAVTSWIAELLPAIVVWAKYLAVAFLVLYAGQKLRNFSFNRYEGLGGSGENGRLRSFRATVALCVAFSLLNPHVYFDLVVLVGGSAAQLPSDLQRVWFGLGAATVSAVWFFALAASASKLKPMLAGPGGERTLDLASGMLLMLVAFGLLWS